MLNKISPRTIHTLGRLFIARSSVQIRSVDNLRFPRIQCRFQSTDRTNKTTKANKMAVVPAIVSRLGSYSDMFAVVGVVTASIIAVKITLALLKFTKSYFLASVLGLTQDLKKAGTWAVITGCTDGIGKAYAEQIAEKGLNVVLISRTQSKLDALAKELKEKYKVETKTIAVDFSRADIYDKLGKHLSGLDIGTLVNNVGRFYDYPEYFVDIENRDQFVMDSINLNVTSCSMLTSIVLPGMVERKRGIIINVASSAANAPLPLLSVYSAAKVYVDYLSRALKDEVADKGITIQSVCPGMVATKSAMAQTPNLMAPAPSVYVRSALATVGVADRTDGFWAHTILAWVSKYLMPNSVMKTVLLQNRTEMIENRKKQEKNQ